MCHSAARLRIVRMARWMSVSASFWYEYLAAGRASFESILEYERGDAVIGEPLADVVSLVRDREHAVTAAGRDDDRDAGGLVRGRQIGRDRRVVDIRQREPGRLSAAVLDDDFLLIALVLEARCTVGPQGDRRRMIGLLSRTLGGCLRSRPRLEEIARSQR